MPLDNLDDNVTVHLKVVDEYMPVEGVEVQDVTDVIDEGCLFLVVDF
jgi:hypothetical protein